jgi:hypothetical protein
MGNLSEMGGLREPSSRHRPLAVMFIYGRGLAMICSRLRRQLEVLERDMMQIQSKNSWVPHPGLLFVSWRGVGG